MREARRVSYPRARGRSRSHRKCRAGTAYPWGVCGRYANTKRPAEIEEHFGVPIHGDVGTRRFNIAPTEEVLAILAPHGEPEADVLRWGLIPSWAKDTKGAHKMINARVETVATSPAYRTLIPKGSRRALQVADGYFEWLKPEKRGEPRQPFFFQVDGGEPFAFAALWAPAKIDGEWLHSLAMLTCDSAPNRVAAAIHGRMPVILADRDARQAWLSAELGVEDVLQLCGALPSSRLSARSANSALNRAGAVPEGPELLVGPG